jgi:hypothetical protein
MENPVLEPEALSLNDFDWPPGVERRSVELESPLPPNYPRNYPQRIELRLRSHSTETSPAPVDAPIDPEDQEPI